MPTTGRRVLVVGTGSLSRAVTAEAARMRSGPTEIAVLGRCAVRAGHVAYLAGATGTLAGSRAAVRAVGVSEVTAARIAPVLERIRPSVVLVCASLQSPWEHRTSPSAWSRLVAEAGFGLTLPLQAGLALEVATAAAATGRATTVVNACFPDAVNPVLAALGTAVCIGIGNASLIAASILAGLPALEPRPSVRVLAHHAQLRAPARPEDEALAWFDHRPVGDVTARLVAQRSVPRELLNPVTARAAVEVLDAVLNGTPVQTSLPGPLGLPGGYPVRIQDGRVQLDLPAGYSRRRAIEWNRRAGLRDGIDLDLDASLVTHTPEVAALLARLGADIPERYALADLAEMAKRLTRVRTRLRGLPADPPA